MTLVNTYKLLITILPLALLNVTVKSPTSEVSYKNVTLIKSLKYCH